MGVFNRWCCGTLAALLTLAVVAGCDLFEVENPQEIEAGEMNDPLLMPALVAGAETRFAIALSDAMLLSALATDELIHFESSWANVDHGIFQPDDFVLDVAYTNVAVALFSADDAVQRIRSLLEAGMLREADRVRLEGLLPRALVLSGFARTYAAGLFQAVTLRGGPAQPPEETLAQAVELFTEAEEAARGAGDAASLVAALAGRARARLFLGDPGGAAVDAQAVLDQDPRFVRRIPYSPFSGWTFNAFLRQLNIMATSAGYPVPPGSDPRTAVDTVSGDPLKYFTREAEMTLVRWQEMRLILAEEAWLRGALDDAVAHLNVVRTQGQAFTFEGGVVQLAPFELPPFEIDTAPGAAPPSDQVRDQIIYERAAEFWLEGLRWPDARRYLGSPFHNPSRSPWPPSEWTGSPDPRQVFPIGITELRHNPNLQ